MAHTKTLTLAQAATGPGPANHAFHPEESNRGVVVSIGGVAAAVTATVLIQVSCDNGATWATRMTFSLSGTATLTAPVADTDVDPNGPFPLVRSNVTAITGGGFVTVSMTAATSGMGAA